MASVFFRTLIIYCLLSISLKLMGKRQIGELEVGELVSTLLISEIASLPIADSDIPLFNAVFSILFIVSIEIILSALKNKSEKMKKYIDGEPAFLIYKGVLRQEALKENRLSVNELITEARLQGVGDLSEIYYAVLEQNGKISIIKNGEELAHSIIIDTEIDENALSETGYTKKRINTILKNKGVRQNEVFLMTIDDNGHTNIILKEGKHKK